MRDRDLNEDELFEDLMALYTMNIRKSLMATLLRVMGPKVVPDAFCSDDESVTWRRVPCHTKDSYIVENHTFGKTTLYFYHKKLDTATDRQTRDLTNASIFPTMSPAQTCDVGYEIVRIVNSVPIPDLKGAFQVALNVLETPWCSIQLVALEAPANRTEKVKIVGADASKVTNLPDSKRAPLARKIAEGARKFGKLGQSLLLSCAIP